MLMNGPTEPIRERVDAIYRSDSRRVLATLIRLLGDFDLAEEALQEAFAAAMAQWPEQGLPANPRAWLVSVGRFKVIDGLRRRARFEGSMGKTESASFDYAQVYAQDALDRAQDPRQVDPREWEGEGVEDDRLRLIFTCCHPALPREGQMALTLREVCDLTTEEIAHAFLVPSATLAQRIVRAKARIREEQIPYQVPSRDELRERLDVVLNVVYLVFNEGYFASSGEALTRPDLSSEAIRLGRLLHELLPEPEVLGLLGLMLLTESRRAARTTPQGDLVLLDDQDRSLWNQEQVTEGAALARLALSSGQVGPYTLQAAIAATHAAAPSVTETNWGQVVAMYDRLVLVTSSPVVEVSRAVAVAQRDGPEAGLALIDAILERGELGGYHLAYSARADLCRRLGRTDQALAAYRRALALTEQGPERRLLQRRIAELSV
jgi:RNA polymerase sigma-70 factor (ECF subfamily)